MENLIIDLKNAGYLDTKIVDGQELYHLVTPCRFRIEESIVIELKNSYKSDEEIGGVLWAKPTTQSGEIIYVVDKVGFIRNAIEDKQRNDKLNKSNAYLPDGKQLAQELNDIIIKGYLPVSFHTHPTKGINSFYSLTNPILQTETSDQDKEESSLPFIFGSKKILMPRGLIVGNDISSHDIFIGVYNGFIAPKEFEDSKQKIQQENLQRTADFVTSINLTDGEKIGLVIGALLLLYTIIKYPKFSLPVIIGLGATLPLLMTNTQNIDNPNYFNKLSSGKADIFIPNSDK